MNDPPTTEEHQMTTRGRLQRIAELSGWTVQEKWTQGEAGGDVFLKNLQRINVSYNERGSIKVVGVNGEELPGPDKLNRVIRGFQTGRLPS